MAQCGITGSDIGSFKERVQVARANIERLKPARAAPPEAQPMPVAPAIVEERIHMPERKQAKTAAIPLRVTPTMKQRIDNLCIALGFGQNEFCRDAVEAAVKRLEKKYTNGKPFPKKGKLSVGRRIGS